MSLDLKEVWQKSLSALEQELSRPAFETWIKSITPISLNNDVIVLSAPNEFTMNTLKSKYLPVITSAMHSSCGQSLSVDIIYSQENINEVTPEHKTLEQTDDSKNADTYYKKNNPQLNPRYTFDTFVIGSGNRLAHAAAFAVSESPAKAYNPMFIYGGVGLGKTHLMHAIGHYVLKHHYNLKVLYISSEMFTNDFINAIRDNKTMKFRNKYRYIDVLLVDDIQFLAGKEQTQEEFFHTFNALHENSKQIIISSDRPPREIPTLEERLRTRFEWGLITDIHPPDLETRIAILKKKAAFERINLPEDVSLYIANIVTSNIRELEGALIRIGAFASLNKTSIDLKLAEEALANIINMNPSPKITIPIIQKKVSDFFNLPVADLKNKKRTKEIVLPRQIAMFICRELTDASLPHIGAEFGGRDHTTVMHSIKKIEEEIKLNDYLKKEIENIRKTILG